MSPILPSSTRRPLPLKDIDYDHEINLVDHTRRNSGQGSRSQSANLRPPSVGVASDSSSRIHSDTPLRKHQLRKELARQKYRKYQDPNFDNGGDAAGPEAVPPDDNLEAPVEERGRPREAGKRKRSLSHKEPESAIDVLYENQRGGFLCGMPLFSSRALGFLDPAPWTNVANKTSATDITNAQVPDPSWEWAWGEWTINHDDGADEYGWQYSFAFQKQFSWHKAAWWNSCVRRRAWIRKRVKKHTGYQANQAHIPNSDYFSIHPAQDQERSKSRVSTRNDSAKKSFSVSSLARREIVDSTVEDIEDIGALMNALRFARIDREKTEAVENFIENGGEDLYYLKDNMREVMEMFIFQASRRSLLTYLLEVFNKMSEEMKEKTRLPMAFEYQRPEALEVAKRRIVNLEAAVKTADEEVKKLEFWSDVKDMAEKGQTFGAVGNSQGWGESWAGIDASGPKDVISDKKNSKGHGCEKGEGNGVVRSDGKSKGKGRA